MIASNVQANTQQRKNKDKIVQTNTKSKIQSVRNEREASRHRVHQPMLYTQKKTNKFDKKSFKV